MSRNRKGQSALEYAALITVLAAVVVFLIWGTNPSQNNLRGKVQNTYDSALGKVDTATGWVNATMGGGTQAP